MSTLPAEFLQMAEWVEQNRQDEIGRRTVVNRAYYAAFLEFRKHAQLLDSVGVRGGVHDQMIDRARQLNLATTHPDYDRGVALQDIADLLHEIKGQRTRADYKLDRCISPWLARDVLCKAGIVFDKLLSLGEPRNID